MATEEEMQAWLAGADIEGAKKGRGRSGMAAQWWAFQAVITGAGSLYLAALGSWPWLIVGIPFAAFGAWKAVLASRKQRTWEQLYSASDGDTTVAK